jgi:hypothetical protein
MFRQDLKNHIENVSIRDDASNISDHLPFGFHLNAVDFSAALSGADSNVVRDFR